MVPVPAVNPIGCAEVTPEPASTPTPASFAKLTEQDWVRLLMAPDSYVGNAYTVWGCITQFDAATGPDLFRAQASYRQETDWYGNGENAIFKGGATQLAGYVVTDVVQMNVVSLGSITYTTPQAVSALKVPAFQVVTIKRMGSCS